MKDQIFQMIIRNILSSFLGSLDKAELKIQLDQLIDKIELSISESPNKFDDQLLPAILFARQMFDIPDYPDVKK